jgi:hypothetical protein
LHVGCKSARDRSRREHRDADEEDAVAPESIPQGAAREHECCEEERVRLDHPLHVGDRGAHRRLQRRQGDADDAAVDERHARTENGRGEDAAAFQVLIPSSSADIPS